jgi:hypothetical protein
MSFINIPFVFSAGAVIIASQHNSNFGTISNIVNGKIDNTNLTGSAGITYANLSLGGNIVNADINSSAGIVGSKLASLSTISPGAGIIPSANLPAVGAYIPSGGIIMWSGSIASIPSGWILCNGSSGSPDLRNQFIVCADADVTGVANTTVTGSATQSGSGQLPSTSVGITVHATGTNGTAAVGGVISSGSTGTVSVSFGTGSVNVAVYYALAYIMKT